MTENRHLELVAWKPGQIDSRGFRGRLDERVRAAISSRARRSIDIRNIPAGDLHPYHYQFAYWLRTPGVADSTEVQERWDTVSGAVLMSQSSALANLSRYGWALDDRWNPQVNFSVDLRARRNLDEARKLEREFVFNPVGSDQFQAILRDALAVVREFTPEMAREMEDSISIVSAFACRDAISFSDVQALGTIFICDRFLSSPPQLAEILVHEASHTILNSVIASLPLFSNSASERYKTPLRPDPRPMFGLFHQLFVLTRLRWFHSVMPQGFVGVDGTLQSIDASLRQALAAVRQHARLTNDGERLIASIEASARDWGLTVA